MTRRTVYCIKAWRRCGPLWRWMGTTRAGAATGATVAALLAVWGAAMLVEGSYLAAAGVAALIGLLLFSMWETNRVYHHLRHYRAEVGDADFDLELELAYQNAASEKAAVHHRLKANLAAEAAGHPLPEPWSPLVSEYLVAERALDDADEAARYCRQS